MHWLLPLKYKDNTDWKYAWIPILGPVTGAVIAAVVYLFILKVVG